MKVGLVLEGGAMRGMYTAGVMDVLMQKEIGVNGIIGVSAGALFGVNYLSGQMGRVIRYNKRFNHDPRYMGLVPLLLEGNIVSTKMAYQKVPMELDVFDNQTFRERTKTAPYYAVVSEVETGKPKYVRIRDAFKQMDVLRASASMPFVSRSVKIGNCHYLDGGITDSFPFRWMSGNGYDRLIVILTRDLTYRKKPMSSSMIRTIYRTHPELQERLKTRHIVYNESVEELKQWEEEGKAFVFRPSEPVTISRMERDPAKLQSLYELGLADAEAKMDSLRSYLKED